MIEGVQHIGIAVKDLEDALQKYTKTLGFELLLREVIESRGVEVAILNGKNTLIELVADHSGESTIKKFIDKRGEGIHHLAFNVSDIKNEMGRLTQKDVKLIDRKPREGAHSKKVAFLHPDSFCGVLIELCQD